MKKFVIAVGTTSKQKVDYVKEVLKGLKIKAQLVPATAKSGITEQPLTSDETKRGSINRAREALKQVSEANISVGIEVGYHKNKSGEYGMFCWVTVMDRMRHKFSTQSHRFILPHYHQKILHAGKYLGDNLDDFKKINSPLIHQIDEIIRFRKPFITIALRGAFFRILRIEEF